MSIKDSYYGSDPNLYEEVRIDTMMYHRIRVIPSDFGDIESGKRNFLICRYKDEYKEGSHIILEEYVRGEATGKSLKKKIKYIYRGDGAYGINPIFCILELQEV